MQTPESLKYSAKHQWLRSDDGAVGITDYAQKKLGTIVYIELPEVGQKVVIGQSCGTIESTKAASDLFAPVSGTIVEVNEALLDEPEIVNKDPYNDGWFFKVADIKNDDLSGLLSAADYTKIAI